MFDELDELQEGVRHACLSLIVTDIKQPMLALAVLVKRIQAKYRALRGQESPEATLFYDSIRQGVG